MNVSEAVETRRSIRVFLDRPVERETLTRVLEKAQRAPSGGNLQPWHGIVLAGAPLQALFERVAVEVAKGREGLVPEFPVYPIGLDGAYEVRRKGVGEEMYGALQIPREDRPSRRRWFANNFRAFGAPVLMLVHTPKFMGPPQWSDIDMWLQTVGLLLLEEGIDTCFQGAWAYYTPHIREIVDIPEDHALTCGVAIGYRDPDAPVNTFEVARAPLDEVIRWSGWD